MNNTEWSQQINPLLYRIQQQDSLALKELCKIATPKLLGLITRITHDTHAAEDILQEVFINIWQKAHQYTGSGSAWGWICVMARHRTIDRIRSMKRHEAESSDATPELLDQLAELNDLSDQHWIGQCLVRLKPQTREVILLSCVQGYSHRELSDKLATPLGTIKAWLRRGLQELKQCLAT